MKRKIIISAAAIISAVFILLGTAWYGRLFGNGAKAAKPSEWNLILVNRDYRIPDDYKPQLMELSNGERIDERIYPDLQKMFDDMRAEGIYPFVRSGYRTDDEQRKIILDKAAEYLKQGYSFLQAAEKTQEIAAPVGSSEHQTGLAVDINADLDRCELWEVYGWLSDNAHKYGFILRYPQDKTELTGIAYEPWHYRYVGQRAAQYIYENNLCLEEYAEGIAREQ